MALEPNSALKTRWTLVRRLKNVEDQESWRTFFETYWRLLHAVARKAGLSESEAEDVVQESTISALKQMPTFKADPTFGSFKGWLLNITRRRIVDQFRKRSRLPLLHSSDADSKDSIDPFNNIADPNGNALDALWEKEWNQALIKSATECARHRVTPKQYEIFDLYVLQGWPVEKVGKFLDVSATQVYLAKHRVGDVVKREVQRLEKLMT